MVGKDSTLLSSSSMDRTENDSQNGSYSRRKRERKAKFQTDTENDAKDPDYMSLVDNFVQDVIERAKEEYLSGCANGGIEICENEAERRNRLNADDDIHTEQGKVKKNTNKKSDGKSKGRRKPHYKYSGPVDEREISGYESPEASTLLNKRSEFEVEEPATIGTSNSVYQRAAAAIRRILSCCVGKT